MSAATMVQPQDIARVLGGEQVLGRPVYGLQDLKEAVVAGLPFAAIQNAFRSISPMLRDDEINLLLNVVFSKSGQKRYGELKDEQLQYERNHLSHPKAAEIRVRPIESERAERIARVYALALKAFDDDELAREFLFNRHAKIGNAPPVENLQTDVGAREVEGVLNAIIFGLPF
jgi:putative toxin-antitoxin system antitoxin component (TIGR02293 family)